MDNKGGLFLTKRVISLLIAVIVVGILVYVLVSLFLLLNEGNEVKKAGEQLEKISVVIDIVREGGEENFVDIYPPSEWYLAGFPDYDFPYSAECRTSQGCLCFCEDVDCSEKEKKKCEGYNFDVQVEGNVRKSSGVYYSDVEGVLKLGAIEDLIVYEEGDIIKIKRV